MIKNERQYRITRAQAEKFRGALAQMDRQSRETGETDPLVQQAIVNGMESQLADLEQQIADYEALRSGRRRVVEVDSFEELPGALIQARIAAGLSQKELARRLGVKEQQIQRYEATEYQATSLSRVKEVMRALGIRWRLRVTTGRAVEGRPPVGSK